MPAELGAESVHPHRHHHRPAEPGSAAGLLAGVLDYASALAGLIGLESREAAVHILILAALLLAAVLALAFGYFFLILAATFAISWLTGTSWVWIALAFGLLHLAVAGSLLFTVKLRATRPLFASTAEVVRTEIEGLRGGHQP